MRVNRAATMQTESVQADSPIQDAAEKMRQSNIGLLLVADGSEVVGVVTDRDIVTRSVATGSWILKTTTIRDIMSHPVASIDGEAELIAAASLMAEKRVRRLVVTNEQLEPVGVLSLDDLAFSTRGDSTTGHVLEELAQGPQSAAFFEMNEVQLTSIS